MYEEKVSALFLCFGFLSFVSAVFSTAGVFSVGVFDAGFFDDIVKSEVTFPRHLCLLKKRWGKMAVILLPHFLRRPFLGKNRAFCK
jgi:hypothetical protein